MRLLIFLAVLWATGTLLFAAETTPAPVEAKQPVATAETTSNEAAKGGDTEPAKDPAKTTASAEGTAAADKDDETAIKKDEEEAASKRANAADKKSSPQIFVPSEKVRADFDVSFPIDI